MRIKIVAAKRINPVRHAHTDGPLTLARASSSSSARAAGANMSAATSGQSVSRVTLPLKVGMLVSMLLPETLQRAPPLGKRP